MCKVHTTTYLDVSKIYKIKFIPRHDSGWKYYDEIPRKSSFFGLIVKPAIKAGWAFDDDTSYRRDLTELEMKNTILEYGILYEKSCVRIYFISKDSDYCYFDTDEDAKVWVEKILQNDTSNGFIIIEN